MEDLLYIIHAIFFKLKQNVENLNICEFSHHVSSVLFNFWGEERHLFFGGTTGSRNEAVSVAVCKFNILQQMATQNNYPKPPLGLKPKPGPAASSRPVWFRSMDEDMSQYYELICQNNHVGVFKSNRRAGRACTASHWAFCKTSIWIIREGNQSFIGQ